MNLVRTSSDDVSSDDEINLVIRRNSVLMILVRLLFNSRCHVMPVTLPYEFPICNPGGNPIGNPDDDSSDDSSDNDGDDDGDHNDRDNDVDDNNNNNDGDNDDDNDNDDDDDDNNNDDDDDNPEHHCNRYLMRVQYEEVKNINTSTLSLDYLNVAHVLIRCGTSGPRTSVKVNLGLQYDSQYTCTGCGYDGKISFDDCPVGTEGLGIMKVKIFTTTSHEYDDIRESEFSWKAKSVDPEGSSVEFMTTGNYWKMSSRECRGTLGDDKVRPEVRGLTVAFDLQN
ncbi:hypothetical protein Tco_0657236 [Tanacetum coccineum]|uniref:Uncharacterized protein n=1 Tax=Tanacetum coccineum TaxID=301880 RepID=A0ABQ4XBL6_9ASTR